MARANTDQHWPVTLSVKNTAGDEVDTDGPIVWTSSDGTVVLPRNISADGKIGELKASTVSKKDGTGNEIPVVVTFTVDADLGAGVKTLTTVTEDLFVDPGPSGMGQAITLTLGPAVDDAPSGS
jgi:hypothetical protein